MKKDGDKNQGHKMNQKEDLELVINTGIAALKSAYQKHQSLGADGTEMVRKNQFGETAMRGDVEAERAVIDALRKNSLPTIILSEEHGQTKIADNPTYFGVLDGIDGSAWYKTAQGVGRYATLLGIYSGTNPHYSDYLFSGIMEHATKRLIYGIKGKGNFVLDLETGKIKPTKTSGATELDKNTRIHVDEYWDINKEIFLSRLKGYNLQKYNLCSSVHYANVALGEADLALECTRKGNLEIAAVFGLINESGGKMVTLDNQNLSGLVYREFGQTANIPVITAASGQLADKAVKFFTA